MWQDAYLFLCNDQYLAAIARKHGICNIKPKPSKLYFFDLVEAIISQQLSSKASATIFARLEEFFSSHGGLTPHIVIAIEESEFKGLGISKQKSAYLKNLSQAIISGDLLLESSDKLTDNEIVRKLTKVKGIGIWTAQMFLMFSLARPDIFPANDTGIQNAVKSLLGLKYINSAKLLKISRRWKPFRTAASWYLWKSLDTR